MILRVLLLATFLGITPSLADSPASITATAPELRKALAGRVLSVEEFKEIRKIADKMGLRVWLFGGTASTFAHYVNWDLQRTKGDKRYLAERFDYDWSNIYRSSQDADLVIDGDIEQAKAFEKIVKERFKHLQGEKEVWEVRLLNKKRGTKQALLSSDFLNQHSDSHSTGLIELTAPPPGESSVRDVKNWKQSEKTGSSEFLEDVRQGKITYNFSKKHETTSRSKAGLNPPILSVLRYLMKSFQSEAAMRPEDIAKIKTIIKEFNPNASRSEYVTDWIERNGPKLYLQAVNIERANILLDELGLREKLIKFNNGNPNKTKSLAWWMSKEPLATKPVGTGTGTTAAELGVSVISHSTSDFLAYESITKAHTGDPNFFISRAGVKGERAVEGPGVYAVIGREGGGRSDLTIRLQVLPTARRGTDFSIIYNEDLATEEVFVVHNKAAVRIIPESLDLDPKSYLDFLIGENKFEDSDEALVIKLRRKLSRQLASMSDADKTDIRNRLKAAIAKKKKGQDLRGLAGFFEVPGTEIYEPELISLLKKATHEETLDQIDKNVFGSKQFQSLPNALKVRLKIKNPESPHRFLSNLLHVDNDGELFALIQQVVNQMKPSDIELGLEEGISSRSVRNLPNDTIEVLEFMLDKLPKDQGTPSVSWLNLDDPDFFFGTRTSDERIRLLPKVAEQADAEGRLDLLTELLQPENRKNAELILPALLQSSNPKLFESLASALPPHGETKPTAQMKKLIISAIVEKGDALGYLKTVEIIANTPGPQEKVWMATMLQNSDAAVAGELGELLEGYGNPKWDALVKIAKVKSKPKRTEQSNSYLKACGAFEALAKSK